MKIDGIGVTKSKYNFRVHFNGYVAKNVKIYLDTLAKKNNLGICDEFLNLLDDKAKFLHKESAFCINSKYPNDENSLKYLYGSPVPVGATLSVHNKKLKETVDLFSIVSYHRDGTSTYINPEELLNKIRSINPKSIEDTLL